MITIDGSVPERRHISIIQLDVEHYEQQALAGALATIRRCLPLLVLENVPVDGDWFREHVLSLGYRQTGQVDRNFVFEVRRSQT